MLTAASSRSTSSESLARRSFHRAVNAPMVTTPAPRSLAAMTTISPVYRGRPWKSLPVMIGVACAGDDSAALICVDHHLNSIADTQLLQDSGDMRLGGCIGDDEAIADLGIGKPGN